jgi:hypothetical protein
MNINQIKSKIMNHLQPLTDIAAVYLFGSIAKGNPRAGSDIDIAILFKDENKNKIDRFERRLDLEIELEKEIGIPVDIVDIETAQPVLQHQIRKHGKLILEKDHSYRVRFEVASRRRYFDMLRVYRRRNAILLKNLGAKNHG